MMYILPKYKKYNLMIIHPNIQISSKSPLTSTIHTEAIIYLLYDFRAIKMPF